MCELCRAFGSEYSTVFHSDSLQPSAGSSESSYAGPAPAYASAVGIGATGNQNIDGLLSGYRWSGTVTYSFPDSASDYPSNYGYGEPTASGFAQISAQQQAAVHKIMGQIENLTNLDIDFAGSNGADIRLAQSSAANPTAYAYYPNSAYSEGGDVWFGTSYNYTNPKLGDYYHLTHLHELGHSFGLKHGQSGGGVANTALPGDHDALEYSVMTYRSYVGGPTTGYTNEAFGYPQSFMMNDILALQTMYGADYTFNNGVTVYSWSATTGETFVNGVGQGRPGGDSAGASANRVFITIWDGGGEDTYDMSTYSNAVMIDLRPGYSSTTSGVQKAYLGAGHYASGNVYNAYLFENNSNSYVENAIGGSGNDALIGNAVANRLDGGLGDDTLTGGGGDDTFVYDAVGGADVITDFVVGLGTVDRIDLVGFADIESFAEAMAFASQVGSGTVFNFGAGSTLTLLNVLLSALAADDFTFDAAPAGPNEAPTGLELSGTTVAENAAGSVVGDLTVVDPNGDVVFSFLVSDNRFEVAGGPGAYRLKLKSGAALDYEAESQVALTITAADYGGMSVVHDFMIDVVDVSGVVIVGSSSKDTIDSTRTVKSQLNPTSEDDWIYGNGGNDTIRALAGDDYVDGGLGNDLLYGGDGDDVLVGGAGNDKMYGDGGNDTFVVSGADAQGDTFSGGSGVDRVLVSGNGSLTLKGFNAASASIEVWVGNGQAVLGTTSANTLNFSGLTALSGMSYIDGGNGNDTITGSDFADEIRGSAGNDVLYGRDGDDVLIGGAGTDKMYGDSGDDTFVVSGVDALSDTISGGAGVDRVLVTGGGNLTLKGFNAASASIEVWEGNGQAVFGTTSANTLNFSGLTALSGMSCVDGGKGNDTITGSDFADDLRGGAGNDKVQGGGGDDRLDGGVGKDTLTGGADADTFVFKLSGATNFDVITDYNFEDGDVIELSALLDAGYGPTSNVSDFARLLTSGSDLRLQVDLNGSVGGQRFVDVALLQGYATADLNQVLVQFEQQAQVLAA
ncbi:MAG: M10 family metallopeptidase C-terminal domain-containing protein [Xanthobacteraceae bacterium]